MLRTRTSKNVIHKGLRTHSQDHEITPVSFSTINAIVRSPLKPTPPLDLDLFIWLLLQHILCHLLSRFFKSYLLCSLAEKITLTPCLFTLNVPCFVLFLSSTVSKTLWQYVQVRDFLSAILFCLTASAYTL